MPFTTQTHDVSTGALPRWLGPLSVGGKLSLGFGLVLSCSLAMALTAMHAVRATQSDAQQLRSLDRLQGRLAQARLEEKDFGLRASPAAAEQVEDSLRRLLAELPGAQPGASLRHALETNVAEFLEAFRVYAGARREAVEARLRMQAQAQGTGQRFSGLFLDQLDDINQGLEGGAAPVAQQMQLLEEAASLRERLANPAGSIDHTAATQHNMAQQVDAAVGQVSQVVEQNAEDCCRLEEASGSLQRLSANLTHAVGAFRSGTPDAEELKR